MTCLLSAITNISCTLATSKVDKGEPELTTLSIPKCQCLIKLKQLLIIEAVFLTLHRFIFYARE